MKNCIKNNISGIYRIINLVNEKIYIGSAVNCQGRFRVHLSTLNKNNHHSIHFQRSWNKYGSENFSFELIEEVTDQENLLEREQYYLDTLKSYERNIGYNICKTAGSMLGYIHTDESREKMSIFHTGRKLSEETKRKMSESRKGRKVSQKTRDLIAKAHLGRKQPDKIRKILSEAQKGTKRNRLHLKLIKGEEEFIVTHSEECLQILGIPQSRRTTIYSAIKTGKEINGFKIINLKK